MGKQAHKSNRFSDHHEPEGSAAAAHWLVYDGQCPFCRAAVRLLRAMDWLRRIRPMDLHTQAAEVAGRAPDLTREQMMEAMQLITPDGRVYPGFFGFRQAAWLLPALWPTVPLWYLPGLPRLGPAVYAWIARRRYKLSRCSPDGACRL